MKELNIIALRSLVGLIGIGYATIYSYVNYGSMLDTIEVICFASMCIVSTGLLIIAFNLAYSLVYFEGT